MYCNKTLLKFGLETQLFSNEQIKTVNSEVKSSNTNNKIKSWTQDEALSQQKVAYANHIGVNCLFHLNFKLSEFKCCKD